MRLLAAVLVILVAAIQTPLWFGKGGWLRVWELDRQLQAHRLANERLRARNAALDAEVRDLKTGYDAIEERARSELGMIRPDEVFFQVVEPGPGSPPRRRRPFAASLRRSRSSGMRIVSQRLPCARRLRYSGLPRSSSVLILRNASGWSSKSTSQKRMLLYQASNWRSPESRNPSSPPCTSLRHRQNTA